MEQKKKIDKQSYALGLIDGEGCFSIVIKKGRKRLKLPFRPVFSLRVLLRKGNVQKSLKIIKRYFSTGKIYKANPEGYQYVVVDFRVLQRIQKLLQKTPPIVKKKQFILWSKGIDLWDPLYNQETPAKIKAKTILKLAYIRDEISRTRNGKIRRKKWTYNKLKKKIEKEIGSSINETPFLSSKRKKPLSTLPLSFYPSLLKEENHIPRCKRAKELLQKNIEKTLEACVKEKRKAHCFRQISYYLERWIPRVERVCAIDTSTLETLVNRLKASIKKEDGGTAENLLRWIIDTMNYLNVKVEEYASN